MPSVFSRRHPVNFYLALFFITLFWAALALMTGGIFFHNYGTAQFEARNYGLLPILAAEIAGAIYTYFRYFQLAPSIELNNEYIKIYSTRYYWPDVEKVELHGKRSFIFFASKEGTSLILKSGGKRTFLDSLYSNTGEMKRFIQDVVIDKKPFVSAAIGYPTTEETSRDIFTAYKERQLFNYWGIVLWLIEIIMLYTVILNRASPASLIFCSIIMPVSFFGFSHFMNYFELSDTFLLVRNHNLIWRKRFYRLSDIKEIVFEQPEKMPICLRIVTNDFESKQYPAGTLWNKDWRALKKILTEKNIPVRNEASIGYEGK